MSIEGQPYVCRKESVVAVPDAKGYRGIVNKLRDMGIPKRKIFWAAKV